MSDIRIVNHTYTGKNKTKRKKIILYVVFADQEHVALHAKTLFFSFLVTMISDTCSYVE